LAKWDLSKLPEGRKPLPDEWFREKAQMQERIAELEAKLAETDEFLAVILDELDDNWDIFLEPKDGRPCATDEFLAVILDELDDNWDIFEAIKDWVEGDWVNAVQGTTLAELKGEKDE
jgi:ribosome assembly protein YihI (activator of Der GTPase)